MSIASRLRHTVTIERRTLGARNTYGVKAETWSTLRVVKGWLQPKARSETEQSGEGGPVGETDTLFMLPTDITEADRVVIAGVTYSVLDVHNAAGKSQHFELSVRRTEVDTAGDG